MKIQLESGPSSAATHRLTQPSQTLNRRFVSRPTNLAIEAAASSYREPAEKTSRPSRLVNLRMHDTDLARQAAEDAEREFAARRIIETTKIDFSAPPSQEELDHIETAEIDTNDIMPEPDPRALAMEMAADYTAASLSAAATALPTRVAEQDALSAAIYQAKAPTTIDEIARTASEAIAAIRAATNPDDIAEQISALKSFANDIKSKPVMPEMTELADTIEKFISVAEKSTGIQATAPETSAPAVVKPAVKPAKPVARPVARTPKPLPKITIKPAEKVAAKKVATKKIAKTAAKTSAKTDAKRALFAPKTMKALRSEKPMSYALKEAPKYPRLKNEDDTLDRALRSITQAEKASAPRPTRKMRRRGNGKRFALAFGCASVCVAGIIYFVGSNIPDVSIRVAAMQTGVEASYPSYIPRDYSLKGISSEDGKITLSFFGPDGACFTLVEEKSSWDSSALQRNYVESVWSDDYTTTHEQGITIFMNGSNAAWVNGGVLYKINTISGSLTKKQLRNIVTSM